MLEIRAKARRLKAREPKLGADRHRLPAADELGQQRREPRAGGLADLPLAEGARRRSRGAGDRALAALARGREPHRQAAAALRPARVRLPDRRHAASICPTRASTGRSASSRDRAASACLRSTPTRGQLEPRLVTNAFAPGTKPVYKLTTRLGRTIRATAQPQVPRVRRLAAARRPRTGHATRGPAHAAGAVATRTMSDARARAARPPDWRRLHPAAARDPVHVERRATWRTPSRRSRARCSATAVKPARPARADLVSDVPRRRAID